MQGKSLGKLKPRVNPYDIVFVGAQSNMKNTLNSIRDQITTLRVIGLGLAVWSIQIIRAVHNIASA